VNYVRRRQLPTTGELDLETRTALVQPFQGDYYTQVKKETTTAIVEPQRSGRRLGLAAALFAAVDPNLVDSLRAKQEAIQKAKQRLRDVVAGG
jgi:hypothetical protein